MTELIPGPQDHEPLDPSCEESGVLSIDRLSERLGFNETEEMSELRADYVAARLSGEIEAARKIVTEYHQLGQQIVEQYEGEAFTRAQIGLTVGLALLRRDAGATDAYVDDLNDAIDYAGNMGYDDIVESLEAAKATQG